METTVESIIVSNEIEVFVSQETLTDNSTVYNVEIQIASKSPISIKSHQYTSCKEATIAMEHIADNLTYFEIQ